MKIEINWINIEVELPMLNEEYLVVWDMEDGGQPTVTSMDFDLNTKLWSDPRGTAEPSKENKILFWAEKPQAPKVKMQLSPLLIPEPISIDEMERLTYGQCIHGENMACCDICNPYKNSI